MVQRPTFKIAPDFSEGIDRKQLRQIRDRFLSVNERRLQRTYESLSSRQADILRVLPLLYHVNHPLLPGYVSRTTPYGLSLFSPSKDELVIAAGFSRTFRYKADRRHKPEIQSVFIMGSSGTLAHSETSDVDAWICVDPSVSPVREADLAEKARRIDAWANAEGLELHSFIMCAERFKQGQSAPAMDSESSGTAQHLLLLDEFYRTAILLSGRYPMWWLVPPALEDEHDAIVENLLTKRFIKDSEVLDFGGLPGIPKSELIGAGLWQLYKSLESPYKSALKLLLAEVYARELPEYPCLSVEFKMAMYNGELEIEQLDPYYLLYRRLEEYLSRAQQPERLELVRKSFYLKVNKKLSRTVKPRAASWQRVFMAQQIEQWGWKRDLLKHLDERHSWRVSDVLQERQALLNELTGAYRFLAGYARANAIASSITTKDMTLLGRKLYAVFQRKAGKVEHLNLGIAPSIWEENLSLHHASSQDFQADKSAWLLYKELESTADAAFTQPLKRFGNLIELLSWLYFNGIVTRATRLSLVPGISKVSVKDVHYVLDVLAHVYPLPLKSVPQLAYEQNAKVDKVLLLVNLGDDFGPKEDVERRISDRTDSLSYSTERVNLVKTLDQVVLNSWGEISAVRYEVGETLLQTLQAYLQLNLIQSERAIDLIVRCCSAFRTAAVEERVSALFYETRLAFLSHSGAPRDLRYVLEIGAAYYVIERIEQQFRFERFVSEFELFDRLRKTERPYQPIQLDSYALQEYRMLRMALPLSKPDQVDVFYQMTRTGIDVCVLDERGSVLLKTLPRQDERLFQSGIYEFLTTVVERRQLNLNEHSLGAMPNVLLFKMTEREDRSIDVVQVNRIDRLEVEAVHAMGIAEQDALRFDLTLQSRDFTYSQYGDQQLTALKHFYQSVSERKNIPLKLVDVSFPADPLGVLRNETQGFETLDYLRVFCDFEIGLSSA